MALGFPLVADKGPWHLFQITEPRGNAIDPGGDFPRELVLQHLKWVFKAPGARDHQPAFGHLPQCLFQYGQAAKMFGLMAVLWVQHTIEIEKQYWHVLAS